MKFLQKITENCVSPEEQKNIKAHREFNVFSEIFSK